MILKKQKDIIFINDAGCIVDNDLLKRAVLWYAGDKFVHSLKHIYIHGRYPAVSIYRKKIHIHRLILFYKMKSKIISSIVVHHKDGNRLNCSEDNLSLDTNSHHASLHNNGKTLSIEHRKKIGEANKKRKGIKIKKTVNIPLVELRNLINDKWTINKIAKYYHCDWSTIKNRIHENPELLGAE